MISVIVPVYKVESYLHECIDSILCQTYRDLEILLINDGSPDRCGEICDEYAGLDTRIRVFHTENRGLSAARNLGLREAKGEYIGFVDSDDWIEPDMYEVLLRRLEETGTNISASGVSCEYLDCKNDYSMSDSVYIGTEAVRALVCELSNGVWNKLYAKRCWTDIGFPVNHTYEEVATLYKVVLKAESLSCVPKPLYHYRMRTGSIVHTPSRENIRDYWTAYFDRYFFFDNIPEFKKNREIMDCLEKQVAFAAVRTWIWTYWIPKDQRDYAFLQIVSCFVQKNFPLFGKKKWGKKIRIGIFFSRYVNDVSFAAMHLIKCFSNFIKIIHGQKLFPTS